MKRFTAIAFIMLAALVGMTGLFLRQKNPPSDYDPALIEPEVDWREVVSSPPSEPGNAAKRYIEVIRKLMDGRGRDADGKVLPELLDVVKEGGRREECNWGTEVLIRLGEAPHRLLPATGAEDLLGHLGPLREIGRSLKAQGDAFSAAGRIDEAVRAYEAAVVLGARTMAGRESLLQVLVGMAIQNTVRDNVAASYLAGRDPGRARQWAEYWSSLDKFRAEFTEKAGKITQAAKRYAETGKARELEYALAVIRHDQDPMMKREAILSLGTVGNLPRRAKEVLEQAERNDEDPYVREAAGKALARLG